MCFSCAGEEANTANNSNITNINPANTNRISAKDDIEELETIIKIPFHPEEALWREENLGNQNAKKMTVVLKFLPEESAKIVAEAEPKKAVTQTILPVETWFPAELVASSQLSGDDTLKGNVYSAEQFFQPPYSDGRLIRMENSSYFILELFSK
ncbi:MAG TPA: hypothetical protein PKY59_20880 [Pyrinomonadaceae bacterium]|nr:hypothetical protein [Pyrinomonadaceae bacterium]